MCFLDVLGLSLEFSDLFRVRLELLWLDEGIWQLTRALQFIWHKCFTISPDDQFQIQSLEFLSYDFSIFR